MRVFGDRGEPRRTAAAVASLIIGLPFTAVGSLAWFTRDSEWADTLVPILLLFVLLPGVLYLTAAAALWHRVPGARAFAILVAGLNFAEAMLLLWVNRGELGPNAERASWMCAVEAIWVGAVGLVLWLLLRPMRGVIRHPERRGFEVLDPAAIDRAACLGLDGRPFGVKWPSKPGPPGRR